MVLRRSCPHSETRRHLRICQTASKNHLKTLLSSAWLRFNFSVWRLQLVGSRLQGCSRGRPFRMLLRNYTTRAYLEGLNQKKVNLEIVHRSAQFLGFEKHKMAAKDAFDPFMAFGKTPAVAESFVCLLGPSNWYVIRKPGQRPQWPKTKPSFAFQLSASPRKPESPCLKISGPNSRKRRLDEADPLISTCAIPEILKKPKRIQFWSFIVLDLVFEGK